MAKALIPSFFNELMVIRNEWLQEENTKFGKLAHLRKDKSYYDKTLDLCNIIYGSRWVV